MERNATADDLEDGTVEALGYNTSYKRMLRGVGNICLVIAMTSYVYLVRCCFMAEAGVRMEWLMQCQACRISVRICILQYHLWRLLGPRLVCHELQQYPSHAAPTALQVLMNYHRGFIIPTCILFPQVLAVAELCSSMPVNGGNFWWTAALAPPSLSRPLSFISGCTTVLATFTGVASFAFASSSGICASASVIRPDWFATQGQKTGVAYAVLALWTSTMSLRIDSISWVLVACSESRVLSCMHFSLILYSRAFVGSDCGLYHRHTRHPFCPRATICFRQASFRHLRELFHLVCWGRRTDYLLLCGLGELGLVHPRIRGRKHP